MSTLDQRLAAQTGQVVAFANDAALAIAREVTRQQRQIAQELRTPVTIETPADRMQRKAAGGSDETVEPSARQDGEAGRDDRQASPADAAAADGRHARIDVRV
jgi:hypothetical protein